MYVLPPQVESYMYYRAYSFRNVKVRQPCRASHAFLWHFHDVHDLNSVYTPTPVRCHAPPPPPAPKVYRLFCQRLSVLASNMQLKGLRAAVADASARAEGIIAADKTNDSTAMTSSSSSSSPNAVAASSSRANATSTPGLVPIAAASARDKTALVLAPTSDVGPKGKNIQRKTAMVTAEAITAANTNANVNAPPPRGKNSSGKGGEKTGGGTVSTWAHARAALLLRTEGVAVALQWVASSKVIQAS